MGFCRGYVSRLVLLTGAKQTFLGATQRVPGSKEGVLDKIIRLGRSLVRGDMRRIDPGRSLLKPV